MTCPKCSSEDWKLASVVHASGLTSTSSSTIGVGTGVSNDVFGNGVGVGAGVGTTHGMQQTELSKRAAPPVEEMRPAKAWAIFGTIIFVIGVIFFGNMREDDYPIFSFFLFVFCPIIVAICCFRLAFGANISKEYAEKRRVSLEEYAKKKMCMRCGTIYRDDEAPSNSTSDAVKKSEAPSNSTSDTVKKSEAPSETKACPFCAETILAGAILCKHCHSKIES